MEPLKRTQSQLFCDASLGEEAEEGDDMRSSVSTNMLFFSQLDESQSAERSVHSISSHFLREEPACDVSPYQAPDSKEQHEASFTEAPRPGEATKHDDPPMNEHCLTCEEVTTPAPEPPGYAMSLPALPSIVSLENFEYVCHIRTVHSVVLSSPRSVFVCRATGIDPSELVPLSPDHFYTADVPRALSKMRYEHFEQRRQRKMLLLLHQRNELIRTVGKSEVGVASSGRQRQGSSSPRRAAYRLVCSLPKKGVAEGETTEMPIVSPHRRTSRSPGFRETRSHSPMKTPGSKKKLVTPAPSIASSRRRFDVIPFAAKEKVLAQYCAFVDYVQSEQKESGASLPSLRGSSKNEDSESQGADEEQIAQDVQKSNRAETHGRADEQGSLRSGRTYHRYERSLWGRRAASPLHGGETGSVVPRPFERVDDATRMRVEGPRCSSPYLDSADPPTASVSNEAGNEENLGTVPLDVNASHGLFDINNDDTPENLDLNHFIRMKRDAKVLDFQLPPPSREVQSSRQSLHTSQQKHRSLSSSSSSVLSSHFLSPRSVSAPFSTSHNPSDARTKKHANTRLVRRSPGRLVAGSPAPPTDCTFGAIETYGYQVRERARLQRAQRLQRIVDDFQKREGKAEENRRMQHEGSQRKRTLRFLIQNERFKMTKARQETVVAGSTSEVAMRAQQREERMRHAQARKELRLALVQEKKKLQWSAKMETMEHVRRREQFEQQLLSPPPQ